MRFVLFLLCAAIVRAASFTPGTVCAGTSLSGSQTCAVGSVTAGQMIWIGLAATVTGANTITVTDGVNTYTQAGTDARLANQFSAIWYAIATTNASITVTATAAAGLGLITIMPAVIAGFPASGFAAQTLQSTNASAQTITCAFTRSGSQLMTVSGSNAAGPVNVGWNTAGSTGTFTLGATQSDGTLSQPGASARQFVTSGTTVNALLNVTAPAAGITCNGFSINDAAAPRHRVSQ